MWAFALVTLLIAALSYAYPQAGGNGTNASNGTCATSTYTDFIIHTTYVYTYTPVVYTYPQSTETLPTTTVTYDSSTTITVETVTSTDTVCTVEPTGPVVTVYTTAVSSKNKRRDALDARQAGPSCTVTTTITTDDGGFAETYVTAPTVTSTVYTNTEQDTVTETTCSGTTIAVASASTTVSADCCTKTLDARCAPSAIITSGGPGGSNGEFGIEYYDASAGTTYVTSTPDAASCCQLCADAYKCAQSVWDSTSDTCTLIFAADSESADLSCGYMYAYYDAGPDSPLAPGAGLWIAPICGGIGTYQAAPDDGT